MEIWLVWLRVGEYDGDTALMEPAHCSRASAMAWCNEHRKLEHGDPIQWAEAGGQEYGESHNIVLDLGRTMLRTVNIYSLQVMKLAGER